MKHSIRTLILATAVAATTLTPAFAQMRPSTLPAVIPSNPIARPSPQPITPLPAPFPDTKPAPPSWPPQGPGYGPGHSWDQSQNAGRYFAGTVKCESQNFRSRTCRARTQKRVEIVQVHGGSCQRNRSFFYDFNGITVTDGCRATFAYGTGNVRPKVDNGSNALPWILAGAGATAGMVALANSGNNNPPPPEPRPAPPPIEQVAPPAPPPPATTPPPVAGPPFPMLPPAKIMANMQMLTADQQRSMQTCLFEGARQTGLAGGSVMTLTSIDQIVQGNGGWRFTARGTATFPDKDRNFSVFCRSSPTQIFEFTVTPRM